MINILEREDGTRKVSISFSDDTVVLRRKSSDRKLTYEYFPERSKAKPEFHKDSNINRIMKKYKRTGILDPLILRDMKYGDFANGSEFSEMFMRVKDAQFEFEQKLSSAIRSRFDNDPAKFLDFMADPANDAEAVSLGLKVAPPAPVVSAEAPADPPAGVSPAVPAAGPAASAAAKAAARTIST